MAQKALLYKNKEKGYTIEYVDEVTGEVMGTDNLPSDSDLTSWRNSVENNPLVVAVEHIEDPSENYSQEPESQQSPETSGPTPSPPPPPPPGATPDQIRQYLDQVKSLGFFAGAGSASRITASDDDKKLSEKDKEKKLDLESVRASVSEQNAEKESDMSALSSMTAGLFGKGSKKKGKKKSPGDYKPKPEKGSTPKVNFGNQPVPKEGARGQMGEPLVEPCPTYANAASDHVIAGKNNTWIVMGRDRPGSLNSGYGCGLKPQTQSGAIDICVGRMSPHVESANEKGERYVINPIFDEAVDDHGRVVVDAARVYVSQKADLDDYFKIVKSSKGIGTIKTRSAVGLKADCIRIMARDGGIKLVTQELGKTNSVFSDRNFTKQPRGIDIIAANDDTHLQPMVLGQNLSNFLTDLLNTISEVVGTVAQLESDVMTLSTALMFHTHPQVGPAAGVPTAFSPEVSVAAFSVLMSGMSKQLFSVFAQKFDMNRLQNDYLRAGSPASKAIMSKFNNVN